MGLVLNWILSIDTSMADGMLLSTDRLFNLFLNESVGSSLSIYTDMHFSFEAFISLVNSVHPLNTFNLE